jgi:signal transduction histidine kinase
MILFNFLTAIWLMAGSGLSAYHLWYSAVVLRVAVWLCLPVYLHLHWVFPRPLGKLPPIFLWVGYGIAVCFAIAEALGLLPTPLYSLVFLLAVGGSLILLLIHIWRQPAIRRDFRLLIIVLLLSIVPAVIWQILGDLIDMPAWYGGAGILSLSFLPLAYLYTAFRRRLGNLELRVNRFFTVYFFIVLLAVVGLPLMALAEYNLNSPDKALIVGSIAASTTTIICIWGYPAFERFLERRLFNIRLPSKRLLESYSTHINTSLSMPELVRVLQEDVLPSLLIRQFAFLEYDQGALNILSTMGLRDESLPNEKDVSYLMTQSGLYLSPDLPASHQPFPWVRLTLSLKLGDQLMGFWLFGRRDPDDLYSQQEIPTLISLANLTAIALSNILQTERLTSMYQANISRYEEERLSLARDLHDSILNELAALPIRSDAPVFSPAFYEAYDAASDHLREIIQGLRPSMLSFGLKLALEDYAEKLRERNPESVEIRTDIQADDDCRYPLMIESNVYRIVQEACENSLRYAHAKHLSISGDLAENQIELRIADDGVGLDPDTSLRFNDLLTHRHFGLAGMHERASVIGAELHIISNSGEGTQIQLLWKSKESI